MYQEGNYDTKDGSLTSNVSLKKVISFFWFQNNCVIYIDN